MSIATLSFKLPKEREEYDMAVNGSKYLSIIDEIRVRLRQKRKYGTVSETTWDKAEQLVLDVLRDYGVDV